MDVAAQRQVSAHLSMVSGSILQSNFLDTEQSFEMPAMTAGLFGVDDGDTIKVVYFTTRGELDDYLSRKTSGFTDSGLRYFKQSPDGWELIFEDLAP